MKGGPWKALALAAILVSLLPVSSAQEPPVDPTAPTKIPHRIPRATGEIEVDGVLDDPAWENALVLELNYEVRPGENLPSSVRTECLLVFDESHFHVGFRAYDPEPHLIRARMTDRDRAFQDDFVGIIVDTFNDERRAFEFFVNPLGVQMDLVQDDVSGREDSSWDAIWRSAGQITDEGYVVEMEIPYTSLRFQRGDGDQTWGIDAIRIYPRDHRYAFALNPRDRNVRCYLCQVSKIVGFEGAKPGANLELVPTVTATRSDRVEEFPDSRLVPGDTDTELGLTARWGFTPNMTLAATLNPDFSQVEADVGQLDVNNPFALFFPERRPFFLEGDDFFRTPVNVVHTRVVADPSWGAKVTGKESRNAVGFFVAQDEITGILIPGSEGSSSTVLEETSIDAVGRYRRDLGQNSTLGAIATFRQGVDYSNGLVGVDALLRPTPVNTVRVQAMASQTEYPNSVVEDFAGTDLEQPAGSFQDVALFLDYSRFTRNWGSWARYRHVGRNFRADLGFIPRVNVRQPEVGLQYVWLGNPDDWWTQMRVRAEIEQTEDQDGNLIERELDASYNMNGPMQSFYHVRPGVRERVFEGVRFDQQFLGFFFEFRPTRSFYLNLDGLVGDRIDFNYAPDPDDPDAGDPPARQGDSVNLGPFLRYNFGRRVLLEASYRYETLDVAGGRAFRAGLSQMRLVYQINLRAFVRAIVQYEDVDRNLDLYPLCPGDECNLEPESRSLFGQFLFAYKFNPQTVIFVGYTSDRLALQDTDLIQTGRSFFIKLGYAWVL